MQNQPQVQLETVWKTVLDGLIVIDTKGVIRALNPSAEKIFQYKEAQILGSNIHELMPEPYKSQHNQYLTSFLKTGEAKVIGTGREVMGMRKDGSVFPMELGVNSMDVDGETLFVGTVKDLSDRFDAQKKATEQANMLTAVLDTVLDGVITIYPDGQIATVNKAAERILQYKEEELLGRNIKMIMPEPYHSHHDSYLANYLTSGERKVIGIGREVLAKRKDGSIFDMELGVSELTQNGQTMFVGTLRDITDQKKANTAKEQAARLNAIMNTVIDGLVTIDEKGTIETFNEAAERIFGYQQKDVIGNNVKMLMPDPYQGHHDDYLSNYLNTGNKKIIGVGREVAAQRKDGSIFPMELAVNEMLIGNKRKFVGTIRDISDLKQAEQNNLEARRELQDIAFRLDFATDAARIGIWEFNIIEHKLIWDPMMYEIHGILSGSEHSLFAEWLALLHPEDAARLEDMAESAMDMSEVFSLQSRLIGKLGQIKWVQLYGKPVINKGGMLTKIIGTAWDMSDIKHAEQLKNDFLATMSHEIRTPINGIMGVLQLLSETSLNDKQSHFTELARTSAHSLLNIINDILDFSKIEAGRLEVEHISFDLRSLLESTTQILMLRAEEKGLLVSLSINSDVPDYVSGDPGRMRQIINNLVNNAIKFTEQGRITIQVSCHGDDHIFVSVKDTGIGIPEEQVSALFTRFTQVDTSTTRKYGGTGLGLAICKELVTLMGGNINVSSKINVGSEFYFTVHMPRSLPPENASEDYPALGEHAWIISQNENIRAQLQFPLEGSGLVVSAFENHKQVLQHVSEETIAMPPMFVFCHVSDSKTSAATLVAVLKAQCHCDDAHFIYIDTGSVRGDGLNASRAGFKAFMSWPFDKSDVVATLSTLVSQDPTTTGMVTKYNTDRSLQLKPRILVAEDNEINQTVITSMLESIGCDVMVCDNGQQVIDHLAAEHDPVDLLLMDCQMPILDGYATAKQIRSGSVGKTLAAIPIVAVTANAMEGDAQKCFDAGMNDYISKPIDKPKLLEKVSQWTRRRS